MITPVEATAPLDVTANNDAIVPPEVTTTNINVTTCVQVEAMRMYCGLDLDELEALLNDNNILYVEPLSVDTSLVKPIRVIPKTIVGRYPKVPKPSVKIFNGQRPKAPKPIAKPVSTELNNPIVIDVTSHF